MDADPDEREPTDQADDGFDLPAWDAAEILRHRARVVRDEADAALRELPDSMTDAEILDEFGIDVARFED